MNLASILILAAVAVLVILALRTIRRSGGSCSCGSSSCSCGSPTCSCEKNGSSSCPKCSK